ncbi:heavy-metal-associated domain-containing protein [bacterium]|nr:heavy-metal-associated domain-containing protein [bacterium]
MKKFILGKVKNIYKTYALIETCYGLGICHISNFSDYKINDLKEFIRLYKPKQYLILKKPSDDNYQLNLSFKDTNPIFCYPNNKIEHSASGFIKLKQYVYHLAYLESKIMKAEKEEKNMDNVVLQIKNLDCPSCSKKIEKMLEKDFGDKVDPAFDLTTRQLNIDFDPSITVEQIIASIEKAGYKAEILDD